MLNQTTDERIRILVVDDEPVIGDALRLVLESNGFEVVLVEKGREGIIQAAGNRFSLGIIDLFLSDSSGLHVIKTIREKHPEMMLIMMTAKGTPHAFSEATRLGVVGILIKPFRPSDVLQLITRVLAQ